MILGCLSGSRIGGDTVRRNMLKILFSRDFHLMKNAQHFWSLTSINQTKIQ